MIEVDNGMRPAESLAIEVEALVREAAWRATKLCELTSHDPALRLSSACETAKLMLYRGRLRARALPGVPFGEPAWDILLNLFVAREEGGRMSLADLCAATGLAERDVVRALRSLEAAGHVAAEPGTSEAGLSAAGAAAVRVVLEASLLP